VFSRYGEDQLFRLAYGVLEEPGGVHEFGKPRTLSRSWKLPCRGSRTRRVNRHLAPYLGLWRCMCLELVARPRDKQGPWRVSALGTVIYWWLVGGFVVLLGLVLVGTRFGWGWLVLSYICHQRPDRSFFLFASQLGVCCRCTGIYLGSLVTLLAIRPCRSLGFRIYRLAPALLAPLAIDVLGKLVLGFATPPFLRSVTGFAYGAGCALLLSFFLSLLANPSWLQTYGELIRRFRWSGREEAWIGYTLPEGKHSGLLSRRRCNFTSNPRRVGMQPSKTGL